MTERHPPGAATAHWAELEKAAETMWHELFTRIVIETLAAKGSITADSLRDALERHMADDSVDRLTRAKCRGALAALRG